MRRILVLLMASATIAGCSTGDALRDRPATLNFAPEQEEADTESAVLRNYHSADAADRLHMTPREYRDHIVRRQLAADEDDFSAFVRVLRTQRAGFNILSDGIVVALNGVAAVTGGAPTKAALAAASGGVVGVRGSIDKELFNQEALAALIAKMKSARLSTLVPITTGLGQTEIAYPLEQALIDLRAHAYAGTLSGSLQSITADAGAEALSATEELRVVTRDAAYLETQPQRAELQQRIAKLSNDQAVKLVLLMNGTMARLSAGEQNALTAADTVGDRFRKGVVAKRFLNFWLLEHSDRTMLDTLSSNLDIAEKG